MSPQQHQMPQMPFPPQPAVGHSINAPFPQPPSAFPQPPSAAAIGGAASSPQKTAAELERDRVANEAILASMQGAAHRYVRQEMADRLGVEDGGDPSSAATNLRAHKPLEFHPNSPNYNAPVVCVLAITLFGLLPIIGSLSLTVGLIGAVCVYISDYLGYRKGSIMVLIAALGMFQFSLMITNARHISNNMGTLLALVNTGIVCAVIAATAVTQYRWVQVTFPELVVLLERFVLVAAPLASLPSILATCIALCGSRIGAIPFALACLAQQYFFASRRASSFLRRAADDDMDVNAEDVPESNEALSSLPALDRETAAILTAGLAIAPSVAFLFLQSDPHMEPAMIVMTVLGMLCANVIYLLWDPEVTLWFVRPTSTTMSGMLQSDPLGLWPLMLKARPLVLFFGYLAFMEAFIYRLLHSRFQYLFVGVPKPFNGIILLAVGFFVTVILALIQRVLTTERNQGKQVSTDRIAILLLSMLSAVCVAVVAGMPAFFHPLSALSASAFNAYLLDRRNGTNFVLFVVTSTLLLMWWMYRTFSFVIMDLRIMTDATIVPTPVLTMSVLWCYLFGALSFGLSFAENKRPMAFALTALAFQVGWVEHVLYSQRETGVYPGWLVFATSAAGIGVALRLFKNEVLGVEGASAVMAMFAAKLYTFLVEVVGAAYLENNDIDGFRALFITFGFASAVGACFLLSLMELKKRRDTSNTAISGDFVYVYAVLVFLALLCAHNSILRGFVDTLDAQWGSLNKDADALLGAAILLTSLATYPVLSRYARRNAGQDLMAPIGLGLGLVIIHPLAFFTTELIDDGEKFNTTPIGRLFLLLSLVLIVGSRFVPFRLFHGAVRLAYWVFASLFGCVALHLILYPASSIGFSASMFVFIALTVIVIDICHYQKAGAEAWVVYAVSVVAMIAAFVTLASHLGSSAKSIEEWEIHDTARIILIAIGACVNMLLSSFVKFRLLGMPLLPSAIGLTDAMVQHIGVIGNYATLLATCMLMLLNVWANEGDIAMGIVCPTFLLMLVDDGILFFELARGSFRYFPTVLTVLGSLWGKLLYGAYGTMLKAGAGAAVWDVVYALPTLPSHLSLLFLLWHAGTKRGGSRLGGVLLFVIIDFFCIFCSNRPTVQWMAIVGLTGQMVRLYVGEFWTRNVDTIM